LFKKTSLLILPFVITEVGIILVIPTGDGHDVQVLYFELNTLNGSYWCLDVSVLIIV